MASIFVQVLISSGHAVIMLKTLCDPIYEYVPPPPPLTPFTKTP